MRLPSNFVADPIDAGGRRLDAGETVFVERALTYVETTAYNTEFPPTESLKYIPRQTGIHPGAKFYEYFRYTRTGVAALVTSLGQDLPSTGVFLDKYNKQFYDFGAKYEYSLSDLLAAQFASMNMKGPVIAIDAELAIAAREAVNRGHDMIAAVGSTTSAVIPGLTNNVTPDLGILGILNQPSATTYSPATGASGSQSWDLKTPDEKLADLAGAYAALEGSTYKIFTPDTFLLPIQKYRKAAFQRMGDGSDESVISLFKKLNPGAMIDSWIYCQGAGTGGVDRMLAYSNDPRRVKYVTSVEFQQLPVEYRNRVFKTDCIARTVGVVAPYPISILYGDGI